MRRRRWPWRRLQYFVGNRLEGMRDLHRIPAAIQRDDRLRTIFIRITDGGNRAQADGVPMALDILDDEEAARSPRINHHLPRRNTHKVPCSQETRMYMRGQGPTHA